ncbi:MAG: ATP-binding protein [Candidatus Omnitrophica bacterium]|nr:ATP-binding protein [Candidatus Omnitrophota bacterium]
MIITVASGKGGTGKTLVSTSLALSLGAENVRFFDCDVEEPNGYIFLKPVIDKSVKVYLPKPRVNIEKCNFCGSCASACVYNAVAVIKPMAGKTKGSVLFFYELCHSCGACSLACTQRAIHEEPGEKGEVETGTAKNGFFFAHGRLKPSEANPVPLVKAVKKYAEDGKINIIDSSPGTSCPVVQAVNGSDFCLLVTEPTPFGLNDLALAVEMTRELNVPAGVVINRSDIGDSAVEEYCSKEKVPVLLRIPFRREIAVAYSKGIPLVESSPEFREVFKKLFYDICSIVEAKRRQK